MNRMANHKVSASAHATTLVLLAFLATGTSQQFGSSNAALVWYTPPLARSNVQGVPECKLLPFARTQAEAAACLEDFDALKNASRMKKGPSKQCHHVGSRLGEDHVAMKFLSNGGSSYAEWASALWSNSEQPRYFFEAGAYDGIQESNSLPFELCLNWSGVLIEGNPNSYKRLCRAGRQRSHLVHAIPSCAVPSTTRISSGGTDATVNFNPTLTARNQGFAVPCVPLQAVLSQLGILHFDFFSLDVEGAEPQVLSTLDFNQTSAKILMVEVKNRFRMRRNRHLLRAQLQPAGYSHRYNRDAVDGVSHAGTNDVFVGRGY